MDNVLPISIDIPFLNIIFGQMTYEGRLTPNESRAWLYGSLCVFALILWLTYNPEKLTRIGRKIRSLLFKNKP
jgi:hypothetical protein